MRQSENRYRVALCPICGGLWCDERCPAYRPEDDPMQTMPSSRMLKNEEGETDGN